MKKMIFLSFCSILINVTVAYSQCLIEVNSNGFEYNVDVALEATDVIYTQQGSTCNVEVEVTYDIEIDVINQPGWWNENLYVLQGMFDCVGASGTSFFDLPNGGGTGTVMSAIFSFSNEDCTDVSLDCPISIDIQGPELNESVDCGTHNTTLLPISLVDFRQSIQGSKVKVFWSTASEINFSHFVLESTYAIQSWESIGRIEAANTEIGSKYSTEIPLSNRGRFLRLKMVDLDGSFAYSDNIVIPAESKNEILLYPNPTNDILHLTGVYAEQVQIYNSLGQRFTFSFLSDNSLDVSSLKSGLYTIVIDDMSRTISNNFLKL